MALWCIAILWTKCIVCYIYLYECVYLERCLIQHTPAWNTPVKCDKFLVIVAQLHTGGVREWIRINGITQQTSGDWRMSSAFRGLKVHPMQCR